MAAAFGAAGASVDLLIPCRKTLVRTDALKSQLSAYYGVALAVELVCVRSPPPVPVAIHKWLHGLRAALRTRGRAYDVVYSRTVLPVVLGVTMGQRVIFENYDVIDRRRPWTARLLVQLSRASQRLTVITHSELARASLVRAGFDPERAVVFRNGFNRTRLLPALNTAEARRLLGWSLDDRIVGYAGHVDIHKGVRTILELARRTPEITYVAIGDSSRGPAEWFIREAQARQCANVRWFPAVPPGELGPYLYAADVLLIPPTAAPLREDGGTVLPLKTFSYMAAGRPIVAPQLPDTAEVLGADTAVLVPPDVPDAAAAAIRGLFADRQRAGALADAARHAAAEFTWERRAARILAWIAQRRDG